MEKERMVIDQAINAALLKKEGIQELIDLAICKTVKEEFDDAEYVLNSIMKNDPSNRYALNILGVIFKKKGEYTKALEIFEKAVELSPSFQAALMNMGNLLIDMKKPEKAMTCFDKVLALCPNHSSACAFKGIAFSNMGLFKEGEIFFNKAIMLDEKNYDAKYSLAILYYNTNRYIDALRIIEELLNIDANNSKYLLFKARVFDSQGLFNDAISIIKSILIIDQSNIKAAVTLSNIYLNKLNDVKSAKDVYLESYQKNPKSLFLMQKFCSFLMHVMHRKECVDELDIAVSIGRKILECGNEKYSIFPALQLVFLESLSHEEYSMLGSQKELMLDAISDDLTVTNLIFSMSRVKSFEDRLQVLEYHRRLGEKLEADAAKNPIKRKVRQRLNNKTRVGMFSSYLNNTPVGYFAWPVIEKIDRSKFELYCYSASPYVDYVKLEIEKISDKFTSFQRDDSSYEVAQRIHEDGIDILFEMGGITSNNRIGAFAHKVAPIQVSWLGYPQSVGLPTSIDYIVTDKYILPEDPRLIMEKPLVMPETWVAIDKIGFNKVHIVNDIPEDRSGVVTFGTLNAAYKYTQEAIAAWAEIMHMVPNSKFLCVRQNARYNVFRDNFVAHMGKYGITQDRISFIATDINHLECYNYIDIALDTFPHTGGTTTCETLWMGVPVVTLVGPCFFERISYSNLTNVGLSDLCAFSVEEYKKIAVALVRDKERRRSLRRTLRDELLKSPLGQPERFVKNFENKILEVV